MWYSLSHNAAIPENQTVLDYKNFIKGAKTIRFYTSKKDIRTALPKIKHIKTKKLWQQPRYDFSNAKDEEDYGKIVSGFPLKAEKKHFKLKRTCGSTTSAFVGFMDDNTPVRIDQDNFDVYPQNQIMFGSDWIKILKVSTKRKFLLDR